MNSVTRSNASRSKVTIDTTAPEEVGSAKPFGIFPYKSIALNSFINYYGRRRRISVLDRWRTQNYG